MALSSICRNRVALDMLSKSRNHQLGKKQQSVLCLITREGNGDLCNWLIVFVSQLDHLSRMHVLVEEMLYLLGWHTKRKIERHELLTWLGFVVARRPPDTLEDHGGCRPWPFLAPSPFRCPGHRRCGRNSRMRSHIDAWR